MNAPQIGWDARAEIAAPAELMDIARLAYIYGFPSYEMARQRYRALSLPDEMAALSLAGKARLSRLNTFAHSKALSTPATAFVTAANCDALMSRAWFDLSREPLVIHVPDTADRYSSVALMDFFSNNFAVLGRRSAGTIAGNFLLAGPRWDGAAPAGITLIRAPTNAVWAVVRILVNGSDDLAAAHALQDQFTISPSGLSSDVGPPSPDPTSLPVPELETTDLLTFFDVLNAALTENPPPSCDKPILDRLQMIGVGPSLKFNRADFTQPQLDALRQGLASARDMIWAQVGVRTPAPRQAGPSRWPSDALLARLRGPIAASPVQKDGGRRRGWNDALGPVGNFGTRYVMRAQCALAGLALLPREEAMYSSTATDAAGAALNGANRYVLSFSPASLPPVDAFWSLTVYRTDENNRRWAVANEINRYSLGNHTPGLRYGADGSLEISIQHERPASNEQNWLPAPQGPFLLTFRAYLPRRELLDGRYTLPDVQRRPSLHDAFSTTKLRNGEGKSVDERPIRASYDERLDYNHFRPLRKSYIVAASYRSGSTYLCWKLWQTGLLGAPSEVLNPIYDMPALMNRLGASSHSDYISKLLARRASRNGVFGFKAHFRHFRPFLKNYPELLEVLAPVTFIHISRADKTAQAVSLAKALQTERWHSGAKEDPKRVPRYDRGLIAKCLEEVEQQDRDWREWFATHNIAPFRVDYDDLIADAAGVVRSIVELLAVHNDERDEVDVPPAEKQADETNQEWIERFRRETQAGGQSEQRDVISDLNEDAVVEDSRPKQRSAERHFFDRYTRLVDNLPEGPNFDPAFKEGNRLCRRYEVIVLRNRALFENARVLDIMSSHGFWSLAALDAGAAHVVGLEPLRKCINAAEKNFADYKIDSNMYRFVGGDILAALRTFEREQFDVILCREFFEQCHFPHFFRQLSRLRPKHVILDTKITRGQGPLAQFDISLEHDKARIKSIPNHELIAFLCEPDFRWRLIDWQAMGITDWTGIHDYARDVRRTYVLDRR